MDAKDLRALVPELDRFLDTYAPLFGRERNASHARVFVQGLLHGGERRYAENIAEAIDGPPVRTLQAFLATGVWSDAAVLDQMRTDLLAGLADDDAVVNADETGDGGPRGVEEGRVCAAAEADGEGGRVRDAGEGAVLEDGRVCADGRH